MTKPILSSLLTAALLGLLASPAGAASKTEPELSGDAAQGLRLFIANCMVCHGAGGKGNGPYAHNLDKQPTVFASPAFAASRSAEDIYSVISKGGAAHNMSPHMRAWGFRLERQDVADLTAYVLAIANGTGVDMGIPPSGEAGERMYFDYCSACHGPGGQGNGTLAYTLQGNPPRDLTSDAVQDLSDAVLFRAIKAGLDQNNIPLDVSMPSWGNYLSDEQILAIIAYVRSFAEQD